MNIPKIPRKTNDGIKRMQVGGTFLVITGTSEELKWISKLISESYERLEPRSAIISPEELDMK